MGFFKNLKNAVTGGAAKVSVDIQPAQRGTAMPFKVSAVAKADSKMDGVYLLVRAVEKAELKDSDWENGERSTETVRGRRVSFEDKVAVAPGEALQEGQNYQWEGEYTIPQHLAPTVRGQMIQHEWEFQAGLDMTGNDPDSGWVPVEVS